MTNWQEAILTQYSASQKILSIIDTFNQAESLDDFTDEFIQMVWDITTCEKFGLDMWGKIVGVSRYIKADIEGNYFGFSEADTGSIGYPTPFNDEPFWSGEQETTTVRLTNDAYRTLILCKAFSNISISTIPEINKFLMILFSGRGRAFCVNNMGMSIGVTFDFYLESFERAIMQNYDVFPIPSGVELRLNEIVTPNFGFAEATDAYPFNDGTLYNN